ncbi:MAG: DNA-processing protein DprA [Clostridia bacterium]|nr:DNA-processing protein DprA [Clostridia bacterium]
MMQHTDDACATMLLTSQITPTRQELALPLNTGEWHRLRELVRQSGLSGMGELMRLDLSGMMLKLGITEEEAYRICVLLGRMLPLSFSLEGFALRGVDILCIEEKAYPARLRAVLGTKAPPQIYLAGRHELFRQRAVGIVGAQTARGKGEEKARQIARFAAECGYVVVSDGVAGAGRAAEDEAIRAGGKAIEATADALAARAAEPDMKAWLSVRSAAAFSLVHPDAPFTVSHALNRNKALYALCDAVFVMSCESERGVAFQGAAEAVRNRYCDYVYVRTEDDEPAAGALCAKGAKPLGEISKQAFERMAEVWRGAQAEQISIFD